MSDTAIKENEQAQDTCDCGDKECDAVLLEAYKEIQDVFSKHNLIGGFVLANDQGNMTTGLQLGAFTPFELQSDGAYTMKNPAPNAEQMAPTGRALHQAFDGARSLAEALRDTGAHIAHLALPEALSHLVGMMMPMPPAHSMRAEPKRATVEPGETRKDN